MFIRVLGTMLVIRVLGACTPSGHVAILPTPGTDPTTEAVPLQVQNYQVDWREHVALNSTCFFFSGPALPDHEVRNPLGESAELQRADGRMTVRMGDAVFSGAASAGVVRLELTRSFTVGEKWYVTETLELDDGEAPRFGTYLYRECSQSQGRGCESSCTIDSEFSLVEAP